MIVSSLVQLREVEPNINVGIVALGLRLRLLDLFARAGDNNELLSERAG